MYYPIISQRAEAVGVIPPPPGITPDFDNPPSRAHTFVALTIVLMSISTLFTGLRLYTARFILRHIRADDYMLLAAWVFALVFSVLYIINTQYGFGRHLWDVPLPVFSPNFLKFGSIGGTFAGTSIMLTKLSILTLFLRFIPQRNFRVALYTIMTIVVAYSLVTSFEWVFACRPLEKRWDLTITGGSCIDWLKFTVFNCAMNTITDAAILVLPVLFLRKLQLPKKQKIGIVVLLMTGGFILIVSIIRLKHSVHIVNTMDISWESITVGLWWMIEVHIAIVCACISAGKPFLRKYMPRVIGSSYRSRAASARLHTIRSTPRERLSSREAGDDPQDTVSIEDTIKRNSTATVKLRTEPPVKEEYGSDRGLIITVGRETADSDP